jgi:hypothetical protein
LIGGKGVGRGLGVDREDLNAVDQKMVRLVVDMLDGNVES